MVFDVDRSGDYIIRLTVTDNAGNSDYAEFALLWDNGIPTIENINMTEESYDTVAIA
jgi:hypothetical protein